MTNQEILITALGQSAVDLNCRTEDLLSGGRVCVESAANPGARAYLELPFDIDLVSYGNGVVASAGKELLPIARAYVQTAGESFRLFETPQLNALADLIRPLGYRICFMARYFLPDTERLAALSCGYRIREMDPGDFEALYLPEWGNALCEARKSLDVLGMGAFDGEKLIGLAGASADCSDMWQIGIDVLPQYRRRGIASALTSQLALAVLDRGKVPFYCAAWSNLASERNAVRSGFKAAWTELTVKPSEKTYSMTDPVLFLRRAGREDLPAVKSLYDAAIGRPGCTWNRYYPAQENLEEDLKNGGLYLYTDGKRVIGAVSVLIGSDMELDELPMRLGTLSPCELSRITIDASYSGKGLARKMLSELFALLRQQGRDGVRLLAAKCNIAAVKTYRSLDFSFTGECRMYENDYYICERSLTEENT